MSGSSSSDLYRLSDHMPDDAYRFSDYIYKDFSRSGRWVALFDIKKYFPNIVIKSGCNDAYKFYELCGAVEIRKPIFEELMAEKLEEPEILDSLDQVKKVLTRDKAFKGLFNKGHRRWL